MESQLSLHLKNFNNKIKVINQTGAKELILSKLDAQNLQADIFDLLTQIAALTEIKKMDDNEIIAINVDGSKF